MAFAGMISITNGAWSGDLFAAAGITSPAGKYKFVLTVKANVRLSTTASGTSGFDPSLTGIASAMKPFELEWDSTPLYVYNGSGSSLDFGFTVVPVESTVKITTC